jgi:hypothetical protein
MDGKAFEIFAEGLIREIVIRNDEWYARESARRMGITWDQAVANARRNGLVLIDGKWVPCTDV